MDSGSNPYNEELILKSYGLLDSSTIEQLGSTLGRECSTKTTKKVPPRLTGIRHSAHNSLEDSLMPMPKGGFHERAIATINASRKPSEKALRNRSHYFQATSSMKDKPHFPLKIKSTKLNGYTRKKFAELRSKFKTSGPIQTHPMPEIHVIRPNKPHSSLPNVIPESDMSKSPERSITDNETLQTPAVNSRFLFNESSQTNSVPPYIGPNQEKPKRRHQTTKDGDACIFCGLPLYDTLSIEGKEQVIDLSCEHQVHEQCLLLEMELKNMSLQDSTDTSLSSSPIDEAVMRNNSYPKCPKCNNGTIAVPRDSEIKDRLGVQILLYPKTNLLQKLLGKSTGAKVDYSPIQVAGDGISSMVASSVNSLSSNSSPSSNTSFKLDSKLPEEILPVPPDWVLMYDVEDLRKKFITELNTMVEDQDIFPHGIVCVKMWYILGRKDFEDNAAQLKAKILRMQTNLKAMDSNRKNEDKRTIMNLVESAIDKWKIGKTMLVILSDSALDNFKSAGIQSVLIEINTKEACNDSGSEIVNILNWEDIMEVLCEKCHLDFDNVCLSDDSTKDDELDAN
ncbi:hypothetical protein HII12_003444 [Brettanomyces bruxellensis]|uniref:Uncharacterized protein n=1 Tax=Dekkera bruxellensis TaxID=5007 RepID=A0A8H6BDZ2_DEKBR|nr:hypothetical protein HII12_003444 [Brettanomyces bruxellensis]